MLGAAVISSVSPRYWRVANVAYLERFQREEPPNSAAAPDRVPFVGPALPGRATARRKASRCRDPKARGRVSGGPLGGCAPNVQINKSERSAPAHAYSSLPRLVGT